MLDSQQDSQIQSNQLYQQFTHSRNTTGNSKKNVYLSTKPSISDNLEFQTIFKEPQTTKADFSSIGIKDRESLLIRCREAILELEQEVLHERQQRAQIYEKLDQQEITIQNLMQQNQFYKARCQKLERQQSTEELDDFQTQYQQTQFEMQSLSEQISQLTLSRDQHINKNQEVTQQLREAKKQLQYFQNQNNILMKQNEQMQEQLDQNQHVEKQINVQQVEYEKSIRKLEDQLNLKERELSRELDSLQQRSRDETQIIQHELSQQLQNAQSTITKQKADVIDLQDEYEYLKLQYLNIQEERNTMQQSIQEKVLTIQNLENQITDKIKEKDLAITQEKKNFRKKCEEYELQNMEINQQFEKLSSKVTQLEKEKLSCVEYIEKIEGIMQQDEQYIYKLTQQVEFANQKNEQQQELYEQQLSENQQLSETVVELNQQLEETRDELVSYKENLKSKNMKHHSDLQELNQSKQEYELQLQAQQMRFVKDMQDADLIKMQYEEEIDKLTKNLNDETDARLNSETILGQLQNQIFELEKRVDTESNQYLLNTSKLNEEMQSSKIKYERQLKHMQQALDDKLSRYVGTIQDEINYLKNWNDNMLLDQQNGGWGYQFTEHIRHVISRLEDRLQWVANKA